MWESIHESSDFGAIGEMTARTWILLAGIFGGLGVAIGAFGAHSLPGLLSSWQLDTEEIDRRLVTFEKGARYQMYHALALLAVGLLALHRPTPALTVAGLSFLVGIVLFSGLLYAIVFSGVKILGAFVPIGGLAFIVGWIAVAVAGWQMSGGE
jgi:uncharacterized membrane protein YgdD (TMEM256/DUF423 family)